MKKTEKNASKRAGAVLKTIETKQLADANGGDTVIIIIGPGGGGGHGCPTCSRVVDQI